MPNGTEIMSKSQSNIYNKSSREKRDKQNDLTLVVGVGTDFDFVALQLVLVDDPPFAIVAQIKVRANRAMPAKPTGNQ